MLRSLVPVGLSLTLLALAPPLARRAEACSAPYPGLRGRNTYPVTGTVGVPLNARVLVRYGGVAIGGIQGFPGAHIPPVGPDIQLRPRGGEPVAVGHQVTGASTGPWTTETVVILQPAQPLAPNTVYELLDRRTTLPCLTAQECALGAPAVFASFTTGTAIDSAPPRFGGLGSLAWGALDRCESGGCCGPYVSRVFTLRWQSGSDDVAGGALLYNLYRRGQATPASALINANAIALAVPCDGSISSPQALHAEPGDYYLRAVDWAGNEDTNGVALPLPTDGCTGSLPDAGVSSDADETPPGRPPEPSPDGGTPDIVVDASGAETSLAEAGTVGETGADQATASAPKRSSSGGCSTGGQAAPGAGLCLVLMVTAAGLARSRVRGLPLPDLRRARFAAAGAGPAPARLAFIRRRSGKVTLSGCGRGRLRGR